MTLTFIADPAHERPNDADRIVFVDSGADVVPGSESVPAPADIPAPRRGLVRRTLSALLSPLRNRRRPPQDDYLRRDIGFNERQLPREYWEYWWYYH